MRERCAIKKRPSHTPLRVSPLKHDRHETLDNVQGLFQPRLEDGFETLWQLATRGHNSTLHRGDIDHSV